MNRLLNILLVISFLNFIALVVYLVIYASKIVWFTNHVFWYGRISCLFFMIVGIAHAMWYKPKEKKERHYGEPFNPFDDAL